VTTRIEIDLNVRVRGNGTYAGFEDVVGPLAVGDEVEVYESESGLLGKGRVAEIDTVGELVYLSVDWATLTEQAAPQAELAEQTSAQGFMERAIEGIFAKTTWLAGGLGPYLRQPHYGYVVAADLRWLAAGTTAITTWFDHTSADWWSHRSAVAGLCWPPGVTAATSTLEHQSQAEWPMFGLSSGETSFVAQAGKISARLSPGKLVSIAQPGAELNDPREVAA
jgi:hypothetical protein